MLWTLELNNFRDFKYFFIRQISSHKQMKIINIHKNFHIAGLVKYFLKSCKSFVHSHLIRISEIGNFRNKYVHTSKISKEIGKAAKPCCCTIFEFIDLPVHISLLSMYSCMFVVPLSTRIILLRFQFRRVNIVCSNFQTRETIRS